MMLSRIVLCRYLLLVWAALPLICVGQGDVSGLPPDVRLVIDVSGSMKQNDPSNLRQPAVELLVQLLPEQSKAGVWTFGRWVNMLVKHQDVADAWRSDALAKSSKINSVGLYTNIGEALEKASYDLKQPSKQYRSSIILLTDGMVDIDKNPEVNRREWRRIVDEILPKLERAGVAVHTIALSDNADTDLLNKLSLSTGGVAAVAKTADDLMKVFLKAFDVAAPMEQVPLADDGFVIDSSVEEFTALIFRKDQSDPTQLLGPDGERLSADTRSKYVNWYRADNYDLITVKQPLEGQWQVMADMEPDSRVTVVSNLNLRVNPLPVNIFKAQQLNTSFVLQEDGATIIRPEFLSLMEIEASMLAGKDEFDLREIWQQKVDTQVPPADGKFSIALPAFAKEGIYQLSITVDGKSFVREFNHQFTTRVMFDGDVTQKFNDGKMDFVLTVRAFDMHVAVDKTKVVATIVDPDGRNKILPLVSTALDTWQTTLSPESEGQYIANIRVRGEKDDGARFDISLDEIHFNFSIDAGFVEASPPFFDEPVATPSPEPTLTPTPTPVPTPTPLAAADEADTSGGVPAWVIYVLLGVGNLLIAGVGYIAYRKIMGSSSDEEILEQFSDETIEQELDNATESQPEDAELIEPPMEDFEPAEHTAPLTSEAAPEAIETFDEQPGTDLSLDHDAAPDRMDEKADASASTDEPMDDLDDLDEMAVAADAAADADTGSQSEEEEEEDMVAAMLKAQGLDLAEDELDDAISSLIDELENDDSFDGDDENNTP